MSVASSIAKRLKVTPRTVHSLVYTLLDWAETATLRGGLQDHTPVEIAEAAGWEGDAEKFICVLEDYGLIRDGQLIPPPPAEGRDRWI